MGNTIILIIVLGLILWAEFVNGWTDAANSIATIVSTRVLTPKQAVLMATTLNIVGTLSGTAVAATIGKDIINPQTVSLLTITSAMVAIISWSTFAWKYGLPTSESHALIAGLTGSALAASGPAALQSTGWTKVLIGLFFSTFLGFFLAFVIFKIMSLLFANTGISKVRRRFGVLQIFSAGFVAFGHGSNDGQKFMGAFSLALLLGGITTEFTIPFWVIILCASVMGMGTSIGGWRIIKTMGVKLAHLEPQHGFAAETAAAIAIETASRFGIPLSTTHTITSSIMGVGTANRLGGVSWSTAAKIVAAWLLTFPLCGIIAYLFTKVILIVF
jgi:inorganic phosphate transporter, PiT family